MYQLIYNNISMKFTEYISKNQVFSTSELINTVDNPNTVNVLLQRALKSKRIVRIHRGLYVSKIGPFETMSVNPYSIIRALDPMAILSFHSALESYGVAHNQYFMVQFRTEVLRTPFEYDKVQYQPYRSSGHIDIQNLDNRPFGTIKVTTREQTFVDCLSFPERAGGIEEVIRSLSLFPYLDFNQLEVLLRQGNNSLAARAGWLLEAKKDSWRVNELTMESLKKRTFNGPFKLDKQAKENHGWSSKWNLCLPESEDEVRSWSQ